MYVNASGVISVTVLFWTRAPAIAARTTIQRCCIAGPCLVCSIVSRIMSASGNITVPSVVSLSKRKAFAYDAALLFEVLIISRTSSAVLTFIARENAYNGLFCVITEFPPRLECFFCFLANGCHLLPRSPASGTQPFIVSTRGIHLIADGTDPVSLITCCQPEH